MIQKTLAKRYATALLAATHREGTVEETEALFLALREVYEKNAKFRAALASPKIALREKKEMLRRILAGGSAAVREFGDLLVEKHRTNLLPEIAEMYDRLADAFKGVVRVQVESAYPVGEDQLRRMKDRLDRITGKTCSLEASVDRSLQAGVLLRMGDSVIDGTVARRLKGLRERLYDLQKR